MKLRNFEKSSHLHITLVHILRILKDQNSQLSFLN